MSSGVYRGLLENWERTVCATRATEIKLPLVTLKGRPPLRGDCNMFVTISSTSSRFPASPVRLRSR
jgi:hypothetical protein